MRETANAESLENTVRNKSVSVKAATSKINNLATIGFKAWVVMTDV